MTERSRKLGTRCWLFAAVASLVVTGTACGGGSALTDGGVAVTSDGGSGDGGGSSDGGARVDGGAPMDGGPLIDGGVGNDGGAIVDGGALVDGGAADGGSPDAGTAADGGSPDGGAVRTQTLDLHAFIIRQHPFCVLGPECAAGETEGCVPVDEDGITLHRFREDSLQVVAPDDPLVSTTTHPVFCMTGTLSAQREQAILTALQAFVDHVHAWTRGALTLRIAPILYDRAFVALAPLWNGLWLPSWELAELVAGVVGTATDGVIALSGVYDPSTGRRFGLAICGGTVDAEFGIGGASYSWIPQTAEAYSFECATADVITHEWLHQLEYTLRALSGFDDLYLDEVAVTRSYPPCGQGDPNPRRWFPGTHDCMEDPDSPWCGQTECGGNDPVAEHNLSVHFDPQVTLVPNRCRNGIQDFDETGIDEGGLCSAGNQRRRDGPSRPEGRSPWRYTPLPRSSAAAR